MGVPILSFFADIAASGALSGQPQAAFEDPLSNKETADLLRAYYAIPDPALRKQFVALAKGMAENLAKSSAK